MLNETTTRTLEAAREERERRRLEGARTARLTPRMLQVLDLLSREHSNADVGIT